MVNQAWRPRQEDLKFPTTLHFHTSPDLDTQPPQDMEETCLSSPSEHPGGPETPQTGTQTEFFFLLKPPPPQFVFLFIQWIPLSKCLGRAFNMRPRCQGKKPEMDNRQPCPNTFHSPIEATPPFIIPPVLWLWKVTEAEKGRAVKRRKLVGIGRAGPERGHYALGSLFPSGWLATHTEW